MEHHAKRIYSLNHLSSKTAETKNKIWQAAYAIRATASWVSLSKHEKTKRPPHLLVEHSARLLLLGRLLLLNSVLAPSALCGNRLLLKGLGGDLLLLRERLRLHLLGVLERLLIGRCTQIQLGT